jgi:hypothetical protein
MRNDRIGASGFSNQRCELALDLESMSLVQMLKIVLQPYLPKADLACYYPRGSNDGLLLGRAENVKEPLPVVNLVRTRSSFCDNGQAIGLRASLRNRRSLGLQPGLYIRHAGQQDGQSAGKRGDHNGDEDRCAGSGEWRVASGSI